MDIAERRYDAIWRDGLNAATRVGATISHHHGVGLLKSGHMHAEHREAMAILRALKHTFDPDGLLNPGKLGLPRFAETVASRPAQAPAEGPNRVAGTGRPALDGGEAP